MNKILLLFVLSSFIPTIALSKELKLGAIEYMNTEGSEFFKAKLDDVSSAVKNFALRVKDLTPLKLSEKLEVVSFRYKDRVKLFSLPFIIINGHLAISFKDFEQKTLKEYLENGGFLLVNADGPEIDKSFRKLIDELYPDDGLVELSSDFPLFNSYYKIKKVPQVHVHFDGLPPQAFGLFVEKRLVLLYLFNSDIIDGWEPESVHKDPKELREEAIRFGINILYYVLAH